MIKSFLSLCSIILFSCSGNENLNRNQLSLAGKWQFTLDTTLSTKKATPLTLQFNETIKLPGTTDENKKGFLNTDTSTMHLNRTYTYEGKAWYKKEVIVPDEFRDKKVFLHLERTKYTQVWIDSVYAGENRLLQSPQIYDVTPLLTPGKHSITILVNNQLSLTPYGNVHIYSDDTQTNWNGILGDLFIEAREKIYIKKIKVLPDVDNQKFITEIELINEPGLSEITIELAVECSENGKTKKLKTLTQKVPFNNKVSLEYELGNQCRLWDEYEQPIYHLSVHLVSGKNRDSKSTVFGMRKFEANGTQFAINGRNVFLRGKHEAAVFPLSGHVPMDMDGWLRVFIIAKNYGINHYRFHSYCPPKAAFEAADRAGIYLQAETPFWGGLNEDSTAIMLQREGFAMLDAYGNHPSFVMFSHGNEIWSGHDRVEENIKAFKVYDSRPLYTMGSNNNIGYVEPRECSDFYVGARIPYAGDTVLTHTRLTHAFSDSRNGGILNTQQPSTLTRFNYAVSHINIPLISHEIAQYQIYPDYDEIKKYTGVLKAWNLEIFRKRLEKAGMADLDSIFQQASGKWSAICYKAEMEAALRTKGMAGFQLLDLQDFPGQGTALVGVLDAFMDSKGVISPETWKHSCNDIVILAEFAKYCWTSSENFMAHLKVANYSNKDLNKELFWQITDQNGHVLKKGNIHAAHMKKGTLIDLEQINTGLQSVNKAGKFNLDLTLGNTGISNQYSIWIYPGEIKQTNDHDLIVTERLDRTTLKEIESGKKALYFPKEEDVLNKSVAGLFPPDFWNYGMFKGISEWLKKPVSPGTLGLLMNPDHPVFNDFPTDFHTNWQWFNIVKNSRSMILDELPHDYFPIIQVIDNLERNHKMALLYEFSLGDGKILVCMSPLQKLTDAPEAQQLLRSITQYIKSDDFNPEYAITMEKIEQLFYYY